VTRHPAVFLDRDGVLNDVELQDGVASSPRSLLAFRVSAGAPELTAALHRAGFLLVGVTNQPDIARGLVSRNDVDSMNRQLSEALGIDAFVVCPHDNGDGCPCRKPRPGMVLEAAERLDIDLDRSWLVGDRWVDIAAGTSAGTRTILLEREYSWNPTSAGAPPPSLRPTVTVSELTACAAAISEERRP
jgi:D-glycero-D-manno-heptose 1,7-bisphosphate phosphatase